MSKNYGCYQYFLKKKSSPSPNVQKSHFCSGIFENFLWALHIFQQPLQWVEHENKQKGQLF